MELFRKKALIKCSTNSRALLVFGRLSEYSLGESLVSIIEGNALQARSEVMKCALLGVH
jgi:hypothetical protein